jgi:hypothetical protein
MKLFFAWNEKKFFSLLVPRLERGALQFDAADEQRESLGRQRQFGFLFTWGGPRETTLFDLT